MNLALEKMQALWVGFLAELSASTRLRVGLWSVMGILLVYGLMLSMDNLEARKLHLRAIESDIGRARSVQTDQAWAARAKEAEQQLSVLGSMAWTEADLGLSEAAFQDWIRNVSSRLGLKTRELSVTRAVEGKFEVPAQRAAPSLPPGVVLMRARLVVDLQRTPLLSFLAEAARNERSIVVDRLVLRANAQPPLAEIEMHALARRQEGKP